MNVWREIVRRYRGHPQVIAYEPLNEAEPRHTEDMSERYRVWNDLAKRITEAIRELDADKPIIINSIEYAHPKAFAGLEHTGDPNTVYSFHWYWPYAFHLQKRPGTRTRTSTTTPARTTSTWWDRNTIRQELEPVIQFANRHKVPLFCGEFGCVSDMPRDGRHGVAAGPGEPDGPARRDLDVLPLHVPHHRGVLDEPLRLQHVHLRGQQQPPAAVRPQGEPAVGPDAACRAACWTTPSPTTPA